MRSKKGQEEFQKILQKVSATIPRTIQLADIQALQQSQIEFEIEVQIEIKIEIGIEVEIQVKIEFEIKVPKPNKKYP